MDRLMYKTFVARSSADSQGNYTFFGPFRQWNEREQGVSKSALESAGLFLVKGYGSDYLSEYRWLGKSPRASIQVMSGQEAAAACR